MTPTLHRIRCAGRRNSLRRSGGIAVGLLFAGLLVLPARAAPPVPSFTVSRANDCAAPCAVFFDARATVDPDLDETHAFHHLIYEWDFGDPGSGTWTYSPIGQSRNVDYGPMAGHVYDQGGIYSVRLRVRDGGDTVETTRQVVVTDADPYWSGTRTVCVSNDDDHTGCPAGALQLGFRTDFDAAVRDDGACNASVSSASVRCLFKRGDSFTASEPSKLAGGPGMIGAYGTGPKPVVYQNASHELFVDASSTHDWRIADLDLRGPDDVSKVLDVTSASSAPRRILLYRVDATAYGAVMRSQVYGKTLGINDPTEIAVVETTSDAHPYDGGGSTLGTRWFGGGRRILLLGNKLVDQKPGDPAHLIRILWMDGGVVAHNLLGDGQAGGNVVKLHNESALSPPCTRDILLADNEFRNWTPHQMATFGPQSGSPSGKGECVERLIIERNLVRNTFAGSVGIGMQLRVMSRQSMIRNNLFDLTPHGHGGGLAIRVELWNTDPSTPRPDQNYILNNTCYAAGQGVFRETECIGVSADATGTVIHNNLMYAPDEDRAKVLTGSGTGDFGDNLVATSNPFTTTSPVAPLDFTPSPNGPAAGTGSTHAGDLQDLYGNPRAAGAPTDLGAILRNSGPTAPPVAPVLEPN